MIISNSYWHQASLLWLQAWTGETLQVPENFHEKAKAINSKMSDDAGQRPVVTNSLCTMGCGFYGNSESGGMCSKCFRDSQVANTLVQAPKPVAVESPSTPVMIVDESLAAAEPAMADAITSATPMVEGAVEPKVGDNETESDGATCMVIEDAKMSAVSTAEAVSVVESSEEPPKKPLVREQTNRKRCFECNKKVGFTGIECRCGFVYCSQHRYPDSHQCSYDFKSHDRAHLAERVVGGGVFSKIDHL